MGRSFAEFKKFFFDRIKAKKKAERAKMRALNRYGAYLKTVAKNSMRYRKKASPPGQPPSAHKDGRLAALKKMGRARHNGALLREFLFYAWDPSTKSVVVGPVGFKSKSGPPVPSLHEHGGSRAAEKGEKMTVKNKPGRDFRGRFISKGERVIAVTGTVRFPARPTMNPALHKTKAKFPAAFRDSFR